MIAPVRMLISTYSPEWNIRPRRALPLYLDPCTLLIKCGLHPIPSREHRASGWKRSDLLQRLAKLMNVFDIFPVAYKRFGSTTDDQL
jgi:hypothetical protein